MEIGGIREMLLNIQIDKAGYEDSKAVIDRINFHVNEGELVGLIGPNGAGKSTTIKTILGLLPYIEGTTTILGETGVYSYIPEQPILYDGLTLWEHIELVLAAFNRSDEHNIERCHTYLKQFRLEKHKHSFPTHFSKGMQQKVMLILGLVLEPDVYIIDEPFIGLDPMAMKDFLAILDYEKQRGAGILMTTHVLDTAERICDRFIVVDQGRLVAEGTIADLRNTTGIHGGSLFDCFHHIVQENADE